MPKNRFLPGELTSSWARTAMLGKHELHHTEAGWTFTFHVKGKSFTMTSAEYVEYPYSISIWIEKCFKEAGYVPAWRLSLEQDDQEELVPYKPPVSHRT
jgi:hypothetical protein